MMTLLRRPWFAFRKFFRKQNFASSEYLGQNYWFSRCACAHTGVWGHCRDNTAGTSCWPSQFSGLGFPQGQALSCCFSVRGLFPNILCSHTNFLAPQKPSFTIIQSLTGYSDNRLVLEGRPLEHFPPCWGLRKPLQISVSAAKLRVWCVQGVLRDLLTCRKASPTPFLQVKWCWSFRGSFPEKRLTVHQPMESQNPWGWKRCF